jgi:hypothetical protein
VLNNKLLTIVTNIDKLHGGPSLIELCIVYVNQLFVKKKTQKMRLLDSVVIVKSLSFIF